MDSVNFVLVETAFLDEVLLVLVIFFSVTLFFFFVAILSPNLKKLSKYKRLLSII